jgi:SSS family transporter
MSLSPLDITVFASYMLILFGVGIYFMRQQKSLKAYLLAEQNVHWVIVGVSVLAALFSGITYLGAPSETFFYGTGYVVVAATLFIATPVTIKVFVPFFRKLKVYTAYEYLEKRFDRRLQIIASGFFITRVAFYAGFAIYAPSLAIAVVTGAPFWMCVLVTGAAATIYTTLGGMKAVVWTDTIQFVVLCGGIILVFAFCINKVPGGMSAAWNLARADGKTRFFDFSPSPLVRVTFWGAMLGGLCNSLVQMVTDQISVQRYLTAASLKECSKALWLKLVLVIPIVLLVYLSGTMIYGYYRSMPGQVPAFESAKDVPRLYEHNPKLYGDLIARTKNSEPPDMTQKPGSPTRPLKSDQLLPYFVLHQLPTPLPGLLIAAILGATMAVVSAAINSLATTALMGFRSRSGSQPTVLTAKLLTVVFGVIATMLALFVLGALGSLIKATAVIGAVAGGPLLGLFLLGAFSRRANAQGALWGIGCGLVASFVVLYAKPIFHLSSDVSFLWIGFVATLTTYVVGLVVSLFFPHPGDRIHTLTYYGVKDLPLPEEEREPTPVLTSNV